MAESHVVSALVAKRAELAGLIEHAERQLPQLRADLSHIDGAIRVFAPEMKPAEIAPKQHRNRNSPFRNGELPRIILDVLRDAPEPMDVNELARAVMWRRGLDDGDGRLLADTVARVGKVLYRQKERGVLAGEPGNGRGLLWGIAE